MLAIGDLKVGDRVKQRDPWFGSAVGNHELGTVVYLDGRHVRVCWDVAGHMWSEISDLISVGRPDLAYHANSLLGAL